MFGKIKVYIASILVLLIFTAATPLSFRYAKAYRESVGIYHDTIGGEYLVLPLGCGLSLIILYVDKIVKLEQKKESESNPKIKKA